MNYQERVNQALSNTEGNALDGLLAYAYWAGRVQGVKDVNDKAFYRYEQQVERASNVRYYKMAGKVVGDYNPYECVDQSLLYEDEHVRPYHDCLWGGD